MPTTLEETQQAEKNIEGLNTAIVEVTKNRREGKITESQYQAAISTLTKQIGEQAKIRAQYASEFGAAQSATSLRHAIDNYHPDWKERLIREYTSAKYTEVSDEVIERRVKQGGENFVVNAYTAEQALREIDSLLFYTRESDTRTKKPPRSKGGGFKRKKKRADERIDQQSDQNFLLQNYDKLGGNAPEPHILPRLTIVTTKDENLINKLTVKDKMLSLMNASANDISSMVPYIRFYKKDKNNGKPRIREFKFSKNSQNLEEYLASGAAGGAEIGLKSFNINMTGTNSFTSTRNFQGNLVLYFRSLADMDENRTPAGQMPWTEMLFNHMFEQSPEIAEMKEQQGDAQTQDDTEVVRNAIRSRKAQIYVELGYDFSENVLGGEEKKDLRDAVRSTRLFLSLYPISTNFNFGQDGSAELSLEFTAASESLSDDLDANFLSLGSADEELKAIEDLRAKIKLQERKIIKAEGDEDLTKSQKSANKTINKEIAKLKKDLEDSIAQNRISNYGRFIEYLYKNKRLFSVTVDKEDYFKGSLKKAPAPVVTSDEDAQQIISAAEADLQKENSDDEYLDTSRDKWNKHTVGYFFLGDLLNYAAYTLVPLEQRMGMMSLGKTEAARKAISIGMAVREQSAEVVLGDYSFIKYPPEDEYDTDPDEWIRKARNSFQNVNLSKLPVSYSLYHSFVRNVILNFSGTVMTFDYFLKQAVSKLIIAAMDSSVKGRKASDAKLKLERKGGMQISRITGKSLELEEGRKKVQLIDLDATGARIAKPEISGLLGNEDIKEADLPSNYIILFGSRKPIAGNVGENPDVDAERGIYHLVAGSRSGIVKNIQFKQTSTRLKEINLQKYLKDGQIDAASILRMPYDADVTIFGNPGFYPGQFTWVRPSYVGLGDLKSANSLASSLGLGGLYNIIGVSTRLSPGTLETTLTCVQNNNSYTNEEKDSEESEPFKTLKEIKENTQKNQDEANDLTKKGVL